MIRHIETAARSSQAVVHGRTVYLTGQVALGDSVAAQTTSVLANIERLLAAAGTDKAHIVSATIWLADMANFAEMNSVWDAWVADIVPPCRATGEVRLATPEYRVEIIIIAALPDSVEG